MATIPIEIILQDAEAPVDPTPTPEETNIIAPDTGAGMVGSNNTSSSSSVASIILPTILLVVALVTICTVLIHKHHKHQDNNNKTTKKEKLITVASTTTAVLSATVLVGNLVIPATNAATNVEPGTAELETEDKITIIATREQDSNEAVVATVKNTSYATANLDFGYKVTTSMAEGSTTANLYLDGDETSEYYIAPVVDGTLADNTWGYTLVEPSEDTTYLSIPLEDTPATIVKGGGEIEDEAVDIYYTIKVDKSLPAGTYTGELEYALTDNNFPSTLTTMQGMTTEICEKTFTPGNQVTDPVPTATLEDIRDHKTYTIAKLADGNCWMTQNLDLDLKDNVALTPADSDVSENWTPKNSTLTVDGASVPGWSNSNTEPYSADPGNVYYYTSGNGEGDKRYDSTGDCEREHPDGTCSHYHAGNYYNWSAAVASNNTEGMADQYYNAPSSICPKGWRLPKNRNAEGWAEGNEQDAMVSSYEGIVGELQIRDEGYQAYRSYLDGGFNTIRTNPLWLTRSGGIYYGPTGSTGSSGIYQSSTVAREDSIYQLNVGPNEIQFENGSRRNGYSIRCLAE